MVRRTKEEAQETRSQILQAAEQAFYERGVARTTLADIAALAGVTRGAIYWHFSNKSDLLQALLDLPEPAYWHHPLLLDSAAEKLAKSKSSPALSARRLAGEATESALNALANFLPTSGTKLPAMIEGMSIGLRGRKGLMAPAGWDKALDAALAQSVRKLQQHEL